MKPQHFPNFLRQLKVLSQTPQQHLANVNTVFTRIRRTNVKGLYFVSNVFMVGCGWVQQFYQTPGAVKRDFCIVNVPKMLSFLHANCVNVIMFTVLRFPRIKRPKFQRACKKTKLSVFLFCFCFLFFFVCFLIGSTTRKRFLFCLTFNKARFGDIQFH